MSIRKVINASESARAASAFLRGLVDGLDAVTMLKVTPQPRWYQSGGLRRDWYAVGNDLRTAMSREDAVRSP